MNLLRPCHGQPDSGDRIQQRTFRTPPWPAASPSLYLPGARESSYRTDGAIGSLTPHATRPVCNKTTVQGPETLPDPLELRQEPVLTAGAPYCVATQPDDLVYSECSRFHPSTGAGPVVLFAVHGQCVF